MGAAGQIIAIVFFAVSVVLNIVAIATPGWVYTSTGSQGLFNGILGSTTFTVPRQAPENVAFAFSLIGDVFLVVAIIGAVVAVVTKKDGASARIGGVMGIVAAIFIMIGMASYTGLRISLVEFSLIFWGYSFALGWTSFCLAFVGGIIALVA